VVERDVASVVVARKGSCSDRREGAGSHIPSATRLAVTRVVEAMFFPYAAVFQEVLEKHRGKAHDLSPLVSSHGQVSVVHK
jgi:hypothetical protein